MKKTVKKSAQPRGTSGHPSTLVVPGSARPTHGAFVGAPTTDVTIAVRPMPSPNNYASPASSKPAQDSPTRTE